MKLQVQEQQGEEYHYSNFINALKSTTTKKDYTKRLSYFMDFLGVKTYRDLVENRDKKWIENNIKNFLVYLRNERKISYKSASYYLKVIKKFYYVNSDYDFKWKLIKMYLGDDDDDVEDNSSSSLEDRPYTKQEIQTMINTATDIRVKIIILLISSSGIRMGGIPLLRLCNLKKIEKYNLYQINVYEKSKKSNYKPFCTPECAAVIDTYLNYRKHCGEQLRPESPLIREQFNPSDSFKVNNPKSIGKSLVRYLVNEVLTKYSALKQKLEYDYENRRKIGKNSTMLTHGLRKYFDTESRKAGVYPDFIELLMGHRLPGIRKHYFKPDMNILLEGTTEAKGYVAAIDSLTINEENRLQKQLQQTEEQNNYQKFVIEKKMKEKDEEIEQLKEAIKTIVEQVHKFKNEMLTNQKGIKRFDFIQDEMEEMKNMVLQQKNMTMKLIEKYQKREEILVKNKGILTKEDCDSIEKSVIDSLIQSDPILWQTIMKQYKTT